MLLIYPPMAKACEPPAGIARLAGVLRGQGLSCTMIDANLEGQLFLLDNFGKPRDTWTRRASRNVSANLAMLRRQTTYQNVDRYGRAVSDLNRLLEVTGRSYGLTLSLANYEHAELSPLRSDDLLHAAENFEENIFYPYFSSRLQQAVEGSVPALVGFSLCYLSQALCTFAMIGYVKRHFPSLPIVLGGGLVTSWLRNPSWGNPFAGLVDHFVAGAGEGPLLELLGAKPAPAGHPPSLGGLPLFEYLSPGFILPYAASNGCYWSKCSFCPEKAEENPYRPVSPDRVLDDIESISAENPPALLHFLDNAISPALFKMLIERPPAVGWYGFARFSSELADPEYCKALRRAGCLMLKLGLESGDQGVLDSMGKGVDVTIASQALNSLKQAGIATYVYLLFGTPSESELEVNRTMEYVIRHHEQIGFLNLAVFNMPRCGPDVGLVSTSGFYEGDLSLYTDFIHPKGWGRREIRRFLDQEFRRHPAIAPILRRDPPIFTSNHAPFFVSEWKEIGGGASRQIERWRV